MANEEAFEEFWEQIEADLAESRKVARVIHDAPKTRFEQTDDAVKARVRLLERTYQPHVGDALQKVARHVASLLLENDEEMQGEYARETMKRHRGSTIARLLEAVDEQVAIARWWLTKTA